MDVVEGGGINRAADGGRRMGGGDRKGGGGGALDPSACPSQPSLPLFPPGFLQPPAHTFSSSPCTPFPKSLPPLPTLPLPFPLDPPPPSLPPSPPSLPSLSCADTFAPPTTHTPLQHTPPPASTLPLSLPHLGMSPSRSLLSLSLSLLTWGCPHQGHSSHSPLTPYLGMSPSRSSSAVAPGS